MSINFANVTFIKSAINKNQYPLLDLPKIIVCGKSNVGKSSFINCLLNRKNLCYISSKPGKTQTINFFNIDNSFLLVDTPGYGYALVSKSKREIFAKLINNYLTTTKNIKLVFFLLDSRHKPTKVDLKKLHLLLKHNLNVAIVATKWDKLNQKNQNQAFKNFQEVFKLKQNDFYKTSIVKNYGFFEIKTLISKIILI